MSKKRTIINFYKNWTLPISMATGIILYLIYLKSPFLHPIGPSVYKLATTIQPILIFIMLFLQFNKISPKEIKLKPWHFILLLFQALTFCFLGVFAARMGNGLPKILIESAMLCLVCPSAIACGVITDKLGGSLSGVMTYLFSINCMISLLIPIVIPFVHQTDATFLSSFISIIRKIFPMLMLPCAFAWIIRYTLKGVQKYFLKYADIAFWLWNISLVISLAITTKYLLSSNIGFYAAIAIGFISLICCVLQFLFGRYVGSKYGNVEKITAGQALGQKNTIFIIWLGYTFMTPVTTIVGGFYCIWHNLINSLELYREPKHKKSK